ncbi:MAG: Smr/MutS family protein [Pseudomonadota bacterium]|nr:Smr/MutS family protein [Pseudomonadota bacterium]
MSKLSEEEKSLFASAMQDVAPIKADNKVKQQSEKQQSKRYQQTMQQIRNKNRQHQNRLDEQSSISQYEKLDSVSAFESLMYHRKGIRLQDLSRLKKGEYPIEAELDLHGLTETVADETLQNFINRCYQHNKRCVLIIHGKGYNSEASAPVLKNLVNMRLRQIKKVLAYCSSVPKDGGTGSVYALLKAH